VYVGLAAADGAAVVVDAVAEDVAAVGIVAIVAVVVDMLGVAAAAAATVVEGVHPGLEQPIVVPVAWLHHDVCVLQLLAVLLLVCAVLLRVVAAARLLAAEHNAFEPLELLVGGEVVPQRQPCVVPLPRQPFGVVPLHKLFDEPLLPPLCDAVALRHTLAFDERHPLLVGGALLLPVGVFSPPLFVVVAVSVLLDGHVRHPDLMRAFLLVDQNMYHGFVPPWPQLPILFAPFRPY